MKHISLDNAHTYLSADDAMPEIIKRNLWGLVVSQMDDDIRESVHNDIAPCTEAEFLREYLIRADSNIVIG